MRFFLGSGVGSVSWREWVGSKMGLFQNGKDNWVGVISSFLRVSCWWSSILGIVGCGEDAAGLSVWLDVKGLSEGVPVWHLK